MAITIKIFCLSVIVLVMLVNIQGRPQEQGVTEKSTWNKIKDGIEHGYNVAYDEVHCGFHKVKELVKHHDHDEGSDPCENKPYQQTTPQTVDCTLNRQCPPDRVCHKNRCETSCEEFCGKNTDCKIVNHSPICSCKPGYSGNPFEECLP